MQGVANAARITQNVEDFEGETAGSWRPLASTFTHDLKKR